jgi:hypothetical protein
MHVLDFVDGPNQTYTLVFNQSDTAPANVGLVGIAGCVYNDANGDGVFLPPELGVPNVTVNTTSVTGVQNSTLTNADGCYSFEQSVSTYAITVDVPPGWLTGGVELGHTAQGPLCGGTISGFSVLSAQLTDGTFCEGYNFGLRGEGAA